MDSTPTGEQWTEASVFKVIDAIGAELGAKAIADAHNAALAAEQEKYNGTERTAGRYARSLEFADNLNQQLREQLAAERGRYRDVTNALGMYPAPVHEKVIAFIQQLRKQLDAEREKHVAERALSFTRMNEAKNWEETAARYARDVDKLREQLDAAVEVLGDMIAEFHDDAKPRNEVIAKAAAFIDKTDAALAKAGKGK